MLRINLLPPYIYDDQKKRNYMILGSVVSILVIVACGFWWMTAKSAQEVAQKANDEAKDFQSKYDAEVAAIAKVKQTAADTQAKSDFVNDAKSYNDSWGKVYESIRSMTTPKVVLNSMRFSSATTVELAGFAPTELDVASWWMELRKSPVFAQVQFDLPSHPYTGNAPASAGGASTVGMGGGMNVGMSGGMGGPGAGQAQMMMAMMGGRGGGGGGGGFGGGGTTRSNANVGPTELEGRPGIAFVGHLVLKDPRAAGKSAPTWPAGGSTGGGGGMSGGMSGGPGGGQAAMMSMMMGGKGGGGGAAPASTSAGGGGKGRAGSED